ncbi:DUF4097 family beta strand repeat-containing protein [Gordonibacter sp.]|uniref:DUF4097 family beta strand repeat-containing protein n=2 Tax=Gordonibacter sp. TaxID=1968902 RepID=UPI002FCBDAB1
MAKLTSQSYVKIALVVLLTLALFGVLGFGSCSSWRFWHPGGAGQMLGSASVEATSIRNIEIDWAAGSASVAVGEGNEIELVETSNGSLSKAQSLRWSVTGDTLKVDYGSGWSCMSLASKHLEVRVPKSLAASMGLLSIDGASGDYAVDGISCDKLQVQLASGKLDAQGVRARQLDLDAASGTMRVRGVFAESVRTNVASGKAEVTCDSTCPKTISADMASGNVSMTIPENDGFTLKADCVSGSYSFRNTFEVVEEGENIYRYKDGGIPINLTIISGNFQLEKGV